VWGMAAAALVARPQAGPRAQQAPAAGAPAVVDRLAAVDQAEADLAEGTATEMATAGAMEQVTATAEAMAMAIDPACSCCPDVTNGRSLADP
jgi:hypothetical protein